MTTIAYKDGVIAYDSRVTRGTIIDYDDYEKCIEVKGVKFILTGSSADFPALVDAYFGGPIAPVSLEAEALTIDAGQIYFVGHNKVEGAWKSLVLPDRAYAIGSGTCHALTAMDMGATAAEAVEMAKKRDSSTGGQVRTLVVRVAAEG
ncbi:proteasome subunit beta [Pseudomonas sp. NA-150]|uniref:proteasome subunit beta n=1 Tax=Pseudomonas sp. NA-150 TaxID=3367525 RepID=UPI0037CAD100